MAYQEGKKSKPLYERKKRFFSEFDDFSDEELLGDENILSENNDDEPKKSKTGKGMKLISNSQNFQTLKQMRMMKKYNNKENNLLSQDQLDFARKVVQQKQPDNNIIPNAAYPTFKNLTFTSNNFSLVGKVVKEVAINLNSNTHLMGLTDEVISLIGTLSSCEYKIIKNETEIFILQVEIIKNEKEKMKFVLNFRKQGEDKEFVEYIPQNVSFNLQGEDEAFLEELEIHKEDLGKMMKRLLIYKFDKK